MAYVSGKDGAHTQDSAQQIEPSERMPKSKLSFLLGCKLIYINPYREIRSTFWSWILRRCTKLHLTALHIGPGAPLVLFIRSWYNAL